MFFADSESTEGAWLQASLEADVTVLPEAPLQAPLEDAADFADAAHLTRTFYQMVGMAPSALMRGHFAEIPSPFRAAPGE